MNVATLAEARRVGSYAHRPAAVSPFLLAALALGSLRCGSGDAATRQGNPAEHPHTDAGMHSADGAAVPIPDAGSDAGADAGSDGGDADTTGCGDGKLQPGERCDDGNNDAADGCAERCDAIEEGYVCPEPGHPCASTVECGDSVVNGTETCDDGNLGDGDGCTVACQIETGWNCAVPGIRCVAAKCGDGVRAGNEQCDDGQDPPVAADGCSATCTLEDGYKCPVAGQACAVTTCGDGIPEGTEQCDDMNNDLGDLCTPECKREPNCSAGACVSSCGDGIKLATDSEQCDDGNTVSRDGCSRTCTIEPGYQCALVTSPSDTALNIPVVIRDFKAYAGGAGHIDFENENGAETGILGPLSSPLDANGKPVYAGGAGTSTTHGQAAFDQWYRDVATVNHTFVQTMTLLPDGLGGFVYLNNSFWPIDNLGWGNEGNNHNFHFTSEVRYWFEYTRGQLLDFLGDDDVWVFVNRRLAVDLGGVHGPSGGNVLLDATNEASFGMTEGSIYEIVVLQAERHTSGSNYKLTLSNFTTAHSECTTVCGDDIVAGTEQCDDGKNDGSYGSCTSKCLRGPSCGDGVVQKAHEACDNRVNLTPYTDKGSEACAPGCKLPGFCGDKQVDSLFGEQCDDGNNPGGYGQCQNDCTSGPRCGDKRVQAKFGEECDDGNLVRGDGCSDQCLDEGPG